jgi:hypothetical protein
MADSATLPSTRQKYQVSAFEVWPDIYPWVIWVHFASSREGDLMWAWNRQALKEAVPGQERTLHH